MRFGLALVGILAVVTILYIAPAFSQLADNFGRHGAERYGLAGPDDRESSAHGQGDTL